MPLSSFPPMQFHFQRVRLFVFDVIGSLVQECKLIAPSLRSLPVTLGCDLPSVIYVVPTNILPINSNRMKRLSLLCEVVVGSLLWLWGCFWRQYGEFFSFVRLLCWFCLGASILQVSPLFCVYFYFLYIFIISLIDFNNIEI